MMHIPRLYLQQALAPGLELALTDAAAHHLLRVLKVKPGQPIVIFNGQGGEYRAEVAAVERVSLVVRLSAEQVVNRESPCQLHLAQAILHSDKMDIALQKATECGVSDITPIFSDYCQQRQKAELIAKKQQHWQRVIISATEQCGRDRLPTVHPATLLQAWLPQQTGVTTFVFHPAQSNAMMPTSSNINLLIGPEGGWSQQEINLFIEQRCLFRSLGPRILRAETATVAALTLLQSQYGDM